MDVASRLFGAAVKILLTHERFLPDFGGGGEYIVFETARQLLRRGVDVRVLTAGDPRITAYEGVPTVRLPMHRYRLNAAVASIAAAARDVDLIHTSSYHAAWPSLVAGRWLGKPVVCQMLGLFHGGWKEMRGPVAGRAFMAWERFLVTRRFARTFFLSEYSRELGIALGANAATSVANSPGIALDEYDAGRTKEDVVLFVGKIEQRKGVHDLLAVARRLPNIRFRVVGWGPAAESVRSNAPPNVECAGFKEGQELRNEFARARIFFFPSRAETFGLVLAEAMASGCAIVSTVPLAFEGACVRAGDLDAMVEAIRRLWSDPSSVAQMGRTNAALARRYTWDRYTTQLLVACDEVLRERASRRVALRARSLFSHRGE